MYFVYILYSDKLKVFYKGQTNGLNDRIYRHNSGFESFTKNGIPWKLIWFTTKPDRSQAKKLEDKLKNLSRARTIAFIKKYPIIENVTGLDVSDPPD